MRDRGLQYVLFFLIYWNKKISLQTLMTYWPIPLFSAQKAEKEDVIPIANTTLVSTESKHTSLTTTTTTLAPLPIHDQCPLPSDNPLTQHSHSRINPLVQGAATTIKPPAQFSQPSITFPSKYTLQPASSSSASITIDYLPGPDPHEDSEGVIVVNRSVPLQSTESEEGSARTCWEEDKDHDSGSGILILRVNEPEEPFEANSLNQHLEDTQAQQTSAACKICSCSGQDEDASSHRKGSDGCLNCLQRQNSIRQGQNRKINDGSCFPCSGTSSGRESIHGDQRVLARCGTVNGLRHRGSALTSAFQVTPPPPLTTSPQLPPSEDTLETPGEDDNGICWASRSLDDVVAETSSEMRFEGVRLVPLSQQAALKTSGSLQLVAALSPGECHRDSTLPKIQTAYDLWSDIIWHYIKLISNCDFGYRLFVIWSSN